MNLPELIHQHC